MNESWLNVIQTLMPLGPSRHSYSCQVSGLRKYLYQTPGVMLLYIHNWNNEIAVVVVGVTSSRDELQKSQKKRVAKRKVDREVGWTIDELYEWQQLFTLKNKCYLNYQWESSTMIINWARVVCHRIDRSTVVVKNCQKVESISSRVVS